MEFILGAAVVIVLCIILQVDMSIIAVGTAIIMGIGIVLSALTVILEGFFIFKSKWKEASLTGFEKKEGQKRKTVIYQIDGKEYECAFPANPECMYKNDKSHKVLFSQARGKVYDKYALITYVIWSLSILVFVFYFIKYVF